jgi:hypothetical protein
MLPVKLALALLAIVVSVLTVLSAHFSSKPDGAYYDPRVGAVGNAYWVFEAGQIHIKASGTSKASGSYSPSGGRWVCRDGTILKPGLLGIKMIDRNNPGNSRFLFRRGLGWLADARMSFDDHVK